MIDQVVLDNEEVLQLTATDNDIWITTRGANLSLRAATARDW
jgi:hypothetical protein